MNDFTHLRVASSYSLKYGVSPPSALVAQAADFGMSRLAITDRDGVYGVARFVKACLGAGIAPIIGVDFALARSKQNGHNSKLENKLDGKPLPRIVVLADSAQGWRSLCQLTTAAHNAKTHVTPTVSAELIAQYADGLIVCLGADSRLGELVGARQEVGAKEGLASWRNLFSPASLVIAITNHRIHGSGVGSARHASRMLALADSSGFTVVLSNMVRMASRNQTATAEILDAVRKWMPFNIATMARCNTERFLKNPVQMWAVASEIFEFTERNGGVERLFAETQELAQRCQLDPQSNLDFGGVHLPELELLGISAQQASVVSFWVQNHLSYSR